jgi:hypothetical protein
MVVVFISLIHVFLTIRAVVKSAAERFVPGVVGGVARATLLVVTPIVAFKAGASLLGLHLSVRDANPLLLVTTGLSVLGPLVTIAVLLVARKRYRDVPMAQEERLMRPFSAWLPVGVIDGIFVMIGVLGNVFARMD